MEKNPPTVVVRTETAVADRPGTAVGNRLPTESLTYAYARVSTAEQLAGDGPRRQIDGAKKYASQRGLDLSDDRIIVDSGVSAFTGSNVTKGNLGRFLKLIQSGKIKCAHLIVESKDRLSRQDIRQSQKILDIFLDAGIVVHAWGDNHVYDPEKYDIGDHIKSAVDSYRSYSESKIKVKRQRGTWEEKREEGATDLIPLTASCPAWLELPPLPRQREGKQRKAVDRHFTKRKDRVEIVKKIFKMSASGLGNSVIARQLNKDKVPTFGRSKGWGASSVNSILHNRSVLGEFQPHRMTESRRNAPREPVGDPIKDYFPEIIKPELFYRAEQARNQRKTENNLPIGGRRGKNYANLFSRLLKCGYCGSHVVYSNKGRGDTYLFCHGARFGQDCPGEGRGWRYKDFEASVLAYVKELDLPRIISGQAEATKLNELDTAIVAIEGKLGITEQRRANLTDSLSYAKEGKESIVKKIDEIEKLCAELKAEIEQRRKERAALASHAISVYQSAQEIKPLIARLQKKRDYQTGAAIAAKLKSLIFRMVVCPIGSAPLMPKSIRDRPDRPDLHRRFFTITFDEGGKVRSISPADDDPLRLTEPLIDTTLAEMVANLEKLKKQKRPT